MGAVLEGSLVAACGVFFLLLGSGLIPLRPSQGFDPAAWRGRRGRKLQLTGVVALVLGVALMLQSR